jgi:hypothetical protein
MWLSGLRHLLDFIFSTTYRTQTPPEYADFLDLESREHKGLRATLSGATLAAGCRTKDKIESPLRNSRHVALESDTRSKTRSTQCLYSFLGAESALDAQDGTPFQGSSGARG